MYTFSLLHGDFHDAKDLYSRYGQKGRFLSVWNVYKGSWTAISLGKEALRMDLGIANWQGCGAWGHNIRNSFQKHGVVVLELYPGSIYAFQ